MRRRASSRPRPTSSTTPSTATGAATRMSDAFKGEVESDRSGAEYGEADEENKDL